MYVLYQNNAIIRITMTFFGIIRLWKGMYLESHAGTRPDDVGIVKFVVDVAVRPWGAFEVLAGHAE